MNAPQHPLIAAYAARHGLAPSTRADDRITVVIDDTYRVHLQPVRDGWLAMSARLCALPAGDADRDRLVTEIGKLAAGMLAMPLPIQNPHHAWLLLFRPEKANALLKIQYQYCFVGKKDVRHDLKSMEIVDAHCLPGIGSIASVNFVLLALKYVH